MSTAVDTADVKIKVPSVENPELSKTKVLPNLDNMVLHALPTARRFFLVLASTFPVCSASFFSKSSALILTALVLNAVFCVGQR